jgi:hypothetical protein
VARIVEPHATRPTVLRRATRPVLPMLGIPGLDDLFAFTRLSRGRVAARRGAAVCAVVARYSRPPLRVAALRRSSRGIVDACPPQPSSNLLHGVALRAQERDLLPLRKREIPAAKWLC